MFPGALLLASGDMRNYFLLALTLLTLPVTAAERSPGRSANLRTVVTKFDPMAPETEIVGKCRR